MWNEVPFFAVAQQRIVNVLHNSEQPVSCFAVLDNGVCLVADLTFNLLMVKMKEYYRYSICRQFFAHISRIFGLATKKKITKPASQSVRLFLSK